HPQRGPRRGALSAARHRHPFRMARLAARHDDRPGRGDERVSRIQSDHEPPSVPDLLDRTRSQRGTPGVAGAARTPPVTDRSAPPESLTSVRKVTLVRSDRRTRLVAEDATAAEEPLDVRLHGTSFAVIMRTPGDDRALAAGFLYAERIIRS